MLTEKAKKKIEESLAKYPNKKSAVMDALRAAQDDIGHLTREDMAEIGKILDINPIVCNASAAFYSMYNVEKPVGRYHVQVCRNLSCSLMGAEHIIEHIEKTLGIKTGGTTRDNIFTLSTAECLGSCGTAPMMQINDDYHEDLTIEKVDEILKSLR